MKKILISAAIAASMLSATSYAETVRIGTEGAYAPWNFVDDSGKLAGYEIDLGNALCDAAGVKCEFVANEWDSIIPNLVAGNYDAIMAGMSITDERKQTINFSEEYYPASPSLYAASADASFDFDNLKGVKVGVQGATIQADYAKENLGANNDILSYETADQSVADLAAGNIDLLLADGDFLKPVVDGSGGALGFVGPEIRIGGGVGIGMRKNDSDLQANMAKALEKLKADGTVDKLIKEYFENGPFYSN